MLTYGIPPEVRGSDHLFILNRHTPSGQSRVYRVTQLRTNGVHCQESAGTGPVNLKVVPNECCLGRSPWTNLYAPLFSTPTINSWCEDGMLKGPAIYAIRPVPRLSGHAVAYRWRSLPRGVRWHRASSRQVVPVKGAASASPWTN